MSRISFNEAATWRLGRRTPMGELEQFAAICEELEVLACRCRPIWSDFVKDKKGTVVSGVGLPIAICRFMSPHDVVDLMGHPCEHWPAPIVVWVKAAHSLKEDLDKGFAAHRAAVQALMVHARNGDIDVYGRRDRETRHFQLKPDQLLEPYRLSGDYRNLVPHVSGQPSGLNDALNGTRASYYDVEVPEAQVAWLFGECDDVTGYLEDKIRGWYADVHVAEYQLCGGKPSRSASVDAAKAVFGNVAGLDAILRVCRRDLAPDHWHKGGRPRRGRTRSE
ncbi:MAG: hypothetical protein AB7L90_07935 [Hyphomicrobiaceae bacterium]